MDWDKLRIFHMVAEAGSFTHAGESLGLSQSAISRHISGFEEDLGVPLFHRHARGLILTEQGEILHKASIEIFARMMMVEGQISDTQDKPEGPLTLTIAEFVGTHWLAPRLPRFRLTCPDMRLSILLDDRVFNLGMREADVAIRLYKPDQPGLVQHPLGRIRFAVCAAASYLSQSGTPGTLADLGGHTVMGYPDHVLVPYQNPNWLLEKISSAKGGENVSLLLMNSVSTLYQSVRAGAGIGLLPRFMIRDCGEITEILPGLAPDPVEMSLVYPEERKYSKRIAAFRDFVAHEAEKTNF